MKRVFNILNWALMLIVAVGITSCENEKTPPTLPGSHEIRCNAGDRPQFTFTAGGDWQLSSDATWCKFITYAGEQQDMSGGIGTHTITLKITDEKIKNQPTFAHITIIMGGQSAIIATIERGPDQLYIRIQDVAETNISAIELGYVDWIPFYVEGNFRFAVTDFPEWVELGIKDGNNIVAGAITGVPGERTEAYARIVNNGERECFAITKEEAEKEAYLITFSDESGENNFKFPIKFNGMGTDDLTFTGPTENNFGWEVSLDGKEFRQKDENSGSMVKYSDCLEFNIAAFNNVYHILLIEKVVEGGIPSYTIFDTTNQTKSIWMQFDKEEMRLTVDATDATRYGAVMALPKFIWNKIRSDFHGSILEEDTASGIALPTIANDYLQYMLIEFTQHDFSEAGSYDGMYVYHSLTTLEIPVQNYTNSSLIAEYGVEEAFKCQFINSIDGKKPGIVVDPRIEGWTTEAFEEGAASAEVYYKGEKLKISENEYYLGENKDEVMALHLWGPNEEYTDNVYVVFKVNGVAKKLLVVTPPSK